MRIDVVKDSECTVEDGAACLVAPVYKAGFPVNSSLLTEEDEVALQRLVDRGVITGKASSAYFMGGARGGYGAVAVVGLGPRDDYTPEVLRRAGGEAGRHLSLNRIQRVYLDLSRHEELDPAPFIEGVLLGQYGFDVYKKPPEESPPAKVEAITVVVADAADVEAVRQSCDLAALLCLSANGARHLANTPPNEMTPAALAEFARGIAGESGCECTVLEAEQMATLGMNALLAVAKGSPEPPRLITLHYHHSDDAKTVAILGKGVTFDTGGISLKPSDSMHEMKYDMCGAAAVLCAMMAITELKPKVNVVCMAPAVENKPGERAQRPGDIVKAYNGKTVEVLNTDAEGRLILADAMAFCAEKYKPACMVDLATLTGACVVALGHYRAGLFANDDALARALLDAGAATGERLWRMPLEPDYAALIESEHADIANIGPKGEAGAVTAAAFLAHFAGDTPWAHIDIAGTAWGGKKIPYWSEKHATGFGVRLLCRWILDLSPGYFAN